MLDHQRPLALGEPLVANGGMKVVVQTEEGVEDVELPLHDVRAAFLKTVEKEPVPKIGTSGVVGDGAGVAAHADAVVASDWHY